MSDMENGLEEACMSVMPYVEHRVCMRHLWKSFKRNYPGDLFERLIWTVARSFCQVEKRKALDEIKQISLNAYNELCNKGKDNDGRIKWVWSRCDFRTTSKNHYITNNISESFNAWVLESRSMPICDLIDDIRKKLMKKFELRKRINSTWVGVLTPMAEKTIVEVSRNLPGYVISRGNEYDYEIDDGLSRNLVNLANKDCTCNRWQLTGLPCSHATAIISGWRNLDWSRYVNECFLTKSYQGAYAKGIETLPSKEQWSSKEECVWDLQIQRGLGLGQERRGSEAMKRVEKDNCLKECTNVQGVVDGVITRTHARIQSLHRIRVRGLPGVISVRPDRDMAEVRKDYESSSLSAHQSNSGTVASRFSPPSGNHAYWIVKMKKPGVEVVTKAQMVDYFAQTLAKVLGNEKDAQVCIYNISWEQDCGFCCQIDEECARELSDVPGVLSVQPDLNFESENKNYKVDDMPTELHDSQETTSQPDVKTKRLFVTGLSFYTSEKTLCAAFEPYGELVEVKIIMDKISKRSKGYAFIEYTTEEAAGAALREMNGKIINGWMIVVDVAKTNPPKHNRGRARPPSSSSFYTY